MSLNWRETTDNDNKQNFWAYECANRSPQPKKCIIEPFKSALLVALNRKNKKQKNAKKVCLEFGLSFLGNLLNKISQSVNHC